MKKGDTLFWFLRTLVRQGELRPAYARQIYEKYMSGKNVPFGHALWFNRGWKYDIVVFGSKKAAEDNTYCPVYKLPFLPGYDRRAGKAKIFGTDVAPAPSLREKILKNIKKAVDIVSMKCYNIIRKK